MGTLKSQCCVCGLIYGEKDAPGVNGVDYSHGFCSKACVDAPVMSIMFSNKKFNGAMDMGRAFVVGKRLFWNMVPVTLYTKMDKRAGKLIVFGWNEMENDYSVLTEEGFISEPALKDGAFRLAKRANIPLLLDR